MTCSPNAPRSTSPRPGSTSATCQRADARLEELIARYRRDGPPTFLNWTLLLRGYSALFQEDKERADRCFAEGVDIELPPRTHTPSEPLKARAAFGRGEHQRAFRTLRDHIDELLVTDNMQAGLMDCIEFVAMMAGLGRADDAAPVLDHLESGHLLDGPGWRLLVADPAEDRRPGTHPRGARRIGPRRPSGAASSCVRCWTDSSRADRRRSGTPGSRGHRRSEGEPLATVGSRRPSLVAPEGWGPGWGAAAPSRSRAAGTAGIPKPTCTGRA